MYFVSKICSSFPVFKKSFEQNISYLQPIYQVVQQKTFEFIKSPTGLIIVEWE